ncbi:MAG: N-6 DNA methylase [Roseburia sp.]
MSSLVKEIDKAGEFYTPQAVSKILTRIAIAGQETKKGLSVYDPCMGSGSLQHLRNGDNLHQQKCEELQNIKKFMLQNMFV